jgi:hypothetical protein
MPGPASPCLRRTAGSQSLSDSDHVPLSESAPSQPRASARDSDSAAAAAAVCGGGGGLNSTELLSDVKESAGALGAHHRPGWGPSVGAHGASIQREGRGFRRGQAQMGPFRKSGRRMGPFCRPQLD